MVGRIELQNYITHYKIPEVKFPRSEAKIPKMNSYGLPTDGQIFDQMNLAKDDAIKVANTFGIYFANKDHLTCQLLVCEPRREEIDEIDEIDEESTTETADAPCESIEH